MSTKQKSMTMMKKIPLHTRLDTSSYYRSDQDSRCAADENSCEHGLRSIPSRSWHLFHHVRH
jgi:hypothetical protein